MTTENIITNLETLKAAVEAQPENLFDLSRFRNDTPCGSNFCTVGLACTMPQFQALGFELVATERAYSPGEFSYSVTVNGTNIYNPYYDDGIDVTFGANAADFAFGPCAWQRLFETACDGDFDRELGYEYSWDDGTANMTDKALAIARLDKQIATLKGE